MIKKIKSFNRNIKSIISLSLAAFKLYHILKAVYNQLQVKITLLSLLRKVIVKMNIVIHGLERKTRSWAIFEVDQKPKESNDPQSDSVNLKNTVRESTKNTKTSTKSSVKQSDSAKNIATRNKPTSSNKTIKNKENSAAKDSKPSSSRKKNGVGTKE